MRKDITVTAEPRPSRGKNEAKRQRVAGTIPAVVYGAGGDSVPVTVNPKELRKILNSVTGLNTIFNLAVKDGETTPVMVIAKQVHPIKDHLLHIDLKRIDLTKKLVAKVPVHVEGEPVGVKIQGGQLEIISREIEIECLPDDIPEVFTVNVSQLGLGQSVRASNVPLAEGARLISPPATVIAHVVTTRAVETTEAAGAEGAAAATAEPEVIKKGKKEEEGAAEPKKK